MLNWLHSLVTSPGSIADSHDFYHLINALSHITYVSTVGFDAF